MELTTVADDLAVAHDGPDVTVYDGLEPDRGYAFDGLAFRTLPRPPGELLCRFATVNDVHFGELECGAIEGIDLGPVLRVPDGAEPHPVTMNRGAIEEMAAIDPAAVIVKGDLTQTGSRAEYEEFRSLYEPAFGDRLVAMRGNHDTYAGEVFADLPPTEVVLPGVTLAVVDTTVPGVDPGQFPAEALAWLDELAGSTDQPILLFGHHHVWDPSSRSRPAAYLGINPDDSERLVDLVARHPSILGCFAGHTHRNRARRFAATGDVPWAEVSCVKDYPGAWAEYRVYEGGVLQVFHRVSTPAALTWTDQTRAMFAGSYAGYSFGDIDDRCFAIWPR